MAARLLRVELLSDGRQQSAEGLDVLLLGVGHVRQELLNADVHDSLGQHVELEELSDEPDESESLSLGLLSSVVLVRHERSLLLRLSVLATLGLSVGGSLVVGRLDGVVVLLLSLGGGRGGGPGGPSSLEVLLTTVEEVLSEEATTGDGLTLVVENLLVLDLGRQLLHHESAQTGVHGRPVGLVGRLLEDESNDLSERLTVLLVLGLVGPREDLGRD